MKIKKLGRATDQRLAVLRNQASYLLWYGKLETSVEKAKSLKSYTEKLLTLAINTYDDTIKLEKTIVNAKGEKETKEVINDGPKKLNARRAIMKKVYEIKEQKVNGESQTSFVSRTKSLTFMLQNTLNALKNQVKAEVTLELSKLVTVKAITLQWQLLS